MKIIMDENAVGRTLMRISHEIIERIGETDNVCLVGIRRRGAPIANSIAENIRKFTEMTVYVGELDITLYRDDLTEINMQPQTNKTAIDFDINGKTVVLVDDVIFTGRTVRAAMEAIVKLGRPSRLMLAVLVDRGHRELPIRADFVGKNIPTSLKEIVYVSVPEYDGMTSVAIEEQEQQI